MLNGDTPLPSVMIHPTVVFEILNSFSRRDDRQNRIIGTLMGIIHDNRVEVSFASLRCNVSSKCYSIGADNDLISDMF